VKINRLTYKLLAVSLLLATVAFSPVRLKAQEEQAKKTLSQYVADETGYPRPLNVRLNEIPGQAYRHFHKNFSKVESVTWARGNRGYQVRYQAEGIPGQAFYDQHGNFQYSVRYLDVAQCDAVILERLKREFPGYQADIISEVNNESRLAYLVTLKNAFSMKSVMIRDGEVQVIDDLAYATR
jgi:hypothetical protein